jgi:hypothetical protein
VFTKILSDRLYAWADECNGMYDVQAGFRKEENTIDNIYILQCLVKYVSKKKGRCYAIYVDISKAFDFIPNQHLFYRMLFLLRKCQ